MLNAYSDPTDKEKGVRAMAKRKKREKEKEEAEEEIILPSFDEKKYMEKEIRGAKTTTLVFFYAVIIACISAVFTYMGQWAMGVLLGAVAVVSIHVPLSLMGVDTSAMEKKEWAGNYMVFIFAWLGVWVILSNPPFMDLAHPDIENLSLSTMDEDGNWTTVYHLVYVGKKHTPVWEKEENMYIYAGDAVNISMRITDNVGVGWVKCYISTETNSTEIDLIYSGDGWYYTNHTFSSPGEYTLVIEAGDVNGNVVRWEETFEVMPPV